MALGTTAAVLLGIGAAGAAVGVSKAFGGAKQAAPIPKALPAPPQPQQIQDKAAETIRRKKAAQTKSVFTSPLGIGGEAEIAKKTLLGQ